MSKRIKNWKKKKKYDMNRQREKEMQEKIGKEESRLSRW